MALPYRPRTLVLLAAAVLVLGPDWAAGQSTTSVSPADPMLWVDSNGLQVRGRLDALVGAFGSSGTWFGLGSIDKSVRFKDDRAWAEGWLEPGVNFTYRPNSSFEFYGGFSVGLSGTLGSDPFDQRAQGAVLVENAFAGWRTTNPASSWNVDLSFGQQDYSVGTGMLLWQGAGNGFERGAISLLPRTAWSNATVARLSYDGFSGEAFYLDPNELYSSNTGTRLAGGLFQYRWGEKSKVGIAYARVLESSQAYPLPSLPLFIEDGRRGLQAVNGYAYVEGSTFGIPNAWVRGEIALERNQRIDMRAFAAYGEVGYRFDSLPFSPSLSYGYALFSGDNPNTSRYERFDPLFYGNGLENWYFGANSAYSFLNSNVNIHRLSLNLVVTPRDYVLLQYIHANANQLFSPIQFGQATRLAASSATLTLVNGVSRAPLADEIYAQWVHAFTPQIATTLWGSAAFPGDGIRTIPNAQTKTWLGAGAILSVKY